MDSDRKLFDSGTIAPVNNQVIDVYRSAHLRLDLPVEEHSSSSLADTLKNLPNRDRR